jgi:chemotaxis methyl-accepting protein methylase
MYFEPEVKKSVLSRLAFVLADDGYLFLGAAESVGEASSLFAQVSHDGLWRARPRARPQLRLA